MNLLAEIRAAGGRIALSPTGNIDASHVPAHLVQAIRDNKPAIMRTLSAELMDGMQYRDSAVYYQIDRHFNDWYLQCDSAERTEALSMLSKWDDALSQDLETGAKMIVAEWPRMEALIENRPIAGKALHSLASGIAAGMVARLVIQKPAVNPRPVNLAAFDDEPVTVPVQPPKQEAIDLFPVLPPKSSTGVNTSVFD